MGVVLVCVAEADSMPKSTGPTAHFLTRELNLGLSCSVCDVAFRQFIARLKTVRGLVLDDEGQEVDSAKVSKTVFAALSKGCEVIQKTHALRWDKRTGVPSNSTFVKKGHVLQAEYGTDNQREWARQFLQHRCEWLSDKYEIEIAVKFAQKEVPSASCPVVDCVQKDDDNIRPSDANH